MPMPNPNILRFDGPVDHYVFRPMGIQRCPPAPAGPPPRSQLDVDDVLNVHAPTFDSFIGWQKQSLACTEASKAAARRARDGAHFKQWVALGTLLPATGFLVTSYAMMFSFPFIVPGAMLFVISSVATALLIGFEEKARSGYNEAHSAYVRASARLLDQQESLDAAERTLRRLQTQLHRQQHIPDAPTAQLAPPASPGPSLSAQAAPAPAAGPGYFSGWVPPLAMFGWAQTFDGRSDLSVSTSTATSTTDDSAASSPPWQVFVPGVTDLSTPESVAAVTSLLDAWAQN